MAAFGTDINAGLGKIDYSGQLKGQLMGAEARGEGLNKLVDTAGQVMQGYYKKQEEKKIANFATSNIAAALTTNPAFQKRLGLQSADPKEIGMWLKAVGGGDLTAGAKAGLGIISQLAEEERQSKDLARIMRVGDISGASPEAVKQYLGIAKGQADIANQNAQSRLYNAQAAMAGEPKAGEKAVDPRSFRSTDANGRPIEVTIDVLTGKEIARGPLQSQAPQFGTIPEGKVLNQMPDGKWAFEDIKNAPQDEKSAISKTRISDLIGAAANNYLELDKLGGIVNPQKGTLQNVGARIGASDVGQTVGGAVGTEEQVLRQRISNIRPLMLSSMLQATGMSARALDSNKELQFYLEAMGDTKRDIVSNLAALYAFDINFGSGKALDSVFAQNPKIAEAIRGTAAKMELENPLPTIEALSGSVSKSGQSDQSVKTIPGLGEFVKDSNGQWVKKK